MISHRASAAASAASPVPSSPRVHCGCPAAAELLDGFQGRFVVEGYQAYATAAHVHGGRIRLARYRAHARRTLVEAQESCPETSEALGLIGEMFLIGRGLPDVRCIRLNSTTFRNP
jgi:hypothetical protein